MTEHPSNKFEKVKHFTTHVGFNCIFDSCKTVVLKVANFTVSDISFTVNDFNQCAKLMDMICLW